MTPRVAKEVVKKVSEIHAGAETRVEKMRGAVETTELATGKLVIHRQGGVKDNRCFGITERRRIKSKPGGRWEARVDAEEVNMGPSGRFEGGALALR